MKRTDIIKKLMNKVDCKKYLEIGMGDGTNYKQITCDYKIVVDPDPKLPVTHEMTSDAFFEQNTENFDVIFIDGLHESNQVYKDILNALEILNENGYIICHDMSPNSEVIQRYPQERSVSEWTGDCWKAWVKLRSERTDLFMTVVDTDYGCGIINVGKQTLIKIPTELTWETLANDRVNLLNLISPNKFLEYYD